MHMITCGSLCIALLSIFNRANFNNPTTNIQAGDFGLVTTAQAGRSMLFGLRLDF